MDSNIPVQATPETKTPVVEPVSLAPNNSSNKTKYIFLGVIILFILFILGRGIYYFRILKQQPTSISSLTPTPAVANSIFGKNILEYDLNEETSDHKVKVKNTYAYALDAKEKKLFDSEKMNDKLPDTIKNLIFSQAFSDEMLLVLDKNDNIGISKYNKNTKEIIEEHTVPKSQVINIGIWRDLSFSPDKTNLLYGTWDMNMPSQIYALNLLTKVSKRITTGDLDIMPKWLNNNSISFERGDNSGKEYLWVTDINTGIEEQLLSIDKYQVPNTLFTYTNTSDGKEIVFSSHLNVQEEDIFEIDTSSKKIIKLFHLPYYDFTYPQITNDSRYLIWGSLVGGTDTTRSIFSYDLIKNIQNTICVSSPQTWCGDFNILPQ